MILVGKRMGVKIRIDGRDAKGKNTTRAFTLADCTVDEVAEVVREALIEASKRALAPPAPQGKP